MAHRMRDAGHQLAVHDLREEAAASLLAAGARWASSPRELAGSSDVVFTVLPGPEQVESVVLDPSTGVLAGMEAGLCLVDCTTNAPSVIRRIGAACRQQGVDVLDAPITGGPAGAQQGTLGVMIGGDATVVARCRPLFECFGQHIFHLGPLGSGMAAKLVVQHLFYANIMSTAEAMLIGAKSGLDLRQLVDVIAVSGGNSRILEFFPRLVFGRRFAGLISLEIALKDVRLTEQLAKEAGSPTLMLSEVRGIMEQAEARGWGQEGFLAALQVLEEAAGAALRVTDEA